MRSVLPQFSPVGRLAVALALSAFLVRLASLGLYPLMDTTEARYGEMARIMVETGNWLTPMFDYDVPFWGKPPVFAWLSATGFSMLGVNEFAARLPHLLVAGGVLFLVWLLGRRQSCDLDHAWLAAAILASTVTFSLIGGAVMTDTALTLGTTLAMVSFWLAWQQRGHYWGYLFFVGLAIGLMSKGPLTLLLVGISLFFWLARKDRWRLFHRRLPLFSGVSLMLVLALPWYVAAEFATPGFSDYFLVGEHFKRFVISGWQGDLYGSAHKEVRGMIWLFWLGAALPWSPVLAAQLATLVRRGDLAPDDTDGHNDGYTTFLWSWMLAPLLLFTFSGNILYSYVMPGLPAMALLISHYQHQLRWSHKIFATGYLTPVLLMATAIALMNGWADAKSQKDLLQSWKQLPDATDVPIYYLKKRPFSGQFYSAGRAIELGSLADASAPFYLATQGSLDTASFGRSVDCTEQATVRRHRLYYCR